DSDSAPNRVRWLLDRPVKPGDDSAGTSASNFYGTVTPSAAVPSGRLSQDRISFAPAAGIRCRTKTREAAMGGCGKAAAVCSLGVLVAALQGTAPQRAEAAELVIITNQGATPGVRELATAFGQKTGHKVAVIQEDGAALERRLAAGGQADLVA